MSARRRLRATLWRTHMQTRTYGRTRLSVHVYRLLACVCKEHSATTGILRLAAKKLFSGLQVTHEHTEALLLIYILLHSLGTHWCYCISRRQTQVRKAAEDNASTHQTKQGARTHAYTPKLFYWSHVGPICLTFFAFAEYIIFVCINKTVSIYAVLGQHLLANKYVC